MDWSCFKNLFRPLHAATHKRRQHRIQYDLRPPSLRFYFFNYFCPESFEAILCTNFSISTEASPLPPLSFLSAIISRFLHLASASFPMHSREPAMQLMDPHLTHQTGKHEHQYSINTSAQAPWNRATPNTFEDGRSGPAKDSNALHLKSRLQPMCLFNLPHRLKQQPN